jgi:hypothetical protein
VTETTPRFQFFLSSDAKAIHTADDLWYRPMPVVLADVVDPSPRPPGLSVTYGDYFQAIRAYLSANRFQPLRRAAAAGFPDAEGIRSAVEIRIHLEKHGQYYHPARVVVATTGAPPQTCVVNVAFSAEGQKFLKADFANLKHLNQRYAYDFLPQVHHCGSGRVRKNLAPAMFLGQWLEDYHEFHAGNIRADDTCIVVWDPVSGPRALSTEQAAAVYRRAAAILTAYYNLYSFEHIAAWHHAAGDFVVKVANGRVDVKLITVRAYTPLLRDLEAEPETVVQALLLFVLKLSLRMRLDRLGGTGEVVWLGDFCLAATLGGFWDGLRLQAEHGFIPKDFGSHFVSFLKGLAPGDLLELLAGVADRFPAEDPGTALIRTNLKRHLAGLLAALEKPDFTR